MADFYNVEWLVACPRTEHSEMYQPAFGFQVLASPRQYLAVSFETQLLGIRVEELRNYVRNKQTMKNAWYVALRNLGVKPAGTEVRAS